MGLQRFRPIIGAVAVADEGGLIAGGVRAHRDRGRIPGADPGALELAPARAMSGPRIPGADPGTLRDDAGAVITEGRG